MKTYFFIAWRMVGKRQNGGANFVIKLSLLATILSVMVMILSEGVLVGFKQAVGNKVYAFWGHMRTEALSINSNYFAQVGSLRDSGGRIAKILQNANEVDNFRAYANKYGVLLSDSSLDGVIFKGYSAGKLAPKSGAEPQDFLSKGRWVADSAEAREVVISKQQARDLALDTGKYVLANFIDQQNVSRKRKLKIVGIYHTGIEMYDKNFAFVSLGLIQHLNNWSKDQFGGYEISLREPKQLSSFGEHLYELIPEDWQLHYTKEMFPGIFDWLDLLDLNQYIVIIIMFVVAVLNMATSVITLVMDRSQMIAILKTLGAGGRGIRRIFSYYAAFIALFGILIGNALALFLGFLQNQYQLLKLNSSSYFVENLQLIFNPWHILLLDLIIFLLCYLVLLLPSQLVYKQRVLKVLRF